jgi:hypothetical protein
LPIIFSAFTTRLPTRETNGALVKSKPHAAKKNLLSKTQKKNHAGALSTQPKKLADENAEEESCRSPFHLLESGNPT